MVVGGEAEWAIERNGLYCGLSHIGCVRFPHRAKRVDCRIEEDAAITRNEVLDKLRSQKGTLVERFGVTGLALFGSFARDQATEGSDVDILVRFEGRATSRSYFGVQFFIEDMLGRPVDLVTDKALRPEIRPYVEREAVDV